MHKISKEFDITVIGIKPDLFNDKKNNYTVPYWNNIVTHRINYWQTYTECEYGSQDIKISTLYKPLNAGHSNTVDLRHCSPFLYSF